MVFSDSFLLYSKDECGYVSSHLERGGENESLRLKEKAMLATKTFGGIGNTENGEQTPKNESSLGLIVTNYFINQLKKMKQFYLI